MATMQQPTPQNYEKRLAQFMADIERFARLYPREKYLYPILDMPVFSDLQTALMMADLNYRACEK